MNDVTFVKGEGGLARTLASESQYCGLIWFSDTKPTGFTTNIKQVTSLSHAVTLGITPDNADDLIKVIHYHLKKFFGIYDNQAATPVLYVMIADVPLTTYDFDEIAQLQDFAGGKLRKIGISVPAAITAPQLAAIQAKVTELDGTHKPVNGVLCNFDFSAVTDWTTSIDLALTDQNVQVSIAQDGGGDGAALFDGGTLGYSVGDIGTLLGWASVKELHENFAWPRKFNIAYDGEFDIPALANGDLVSENESLLSGLDTKRYVFLKKHIGLSGTYYNDTHMCCALTSDYAYLENNDVINEAIRGIRTNVLPDLNSPLTIDAATGTLAQETVAHFEGLASKALTEMKNAGNISGYSVYIDPAQDILSTSQLIINVLLVIKGVARNIQVAIGFTKIV